jgi:hypothetical protein
VNRSERSEAAVERSPAKERLVSTVAAGWGATAAEHALARINGARSIDEIRPLLEELARSIFAEAERRFGADPLAELWREAANEAACARFESIELGLPPM